LDSVFFGQIRARVKAEWFNNGPDGKVFKALESFNDSFGRLPTVDELRGWKDIQQYDNSDKAVLLDVINSCVHETSNYGVDVIRNELTWWLSARLYRMGVVESEAEYNNGRFDKCYKIITQRVKEMNEAQFVRDIAKPFSDPALFQRAETRYDNAITFGIKALDDAMVPADMDSGPAGSSSSLLLGDTTLLLAPSNAGKCLRIDTPVIFSDGTVHKVQDVKTGDLLMGPDSKPRKVLSTTRGRGQMYDIVPNSGGETWGCNDVHVLNLKCGLNRAKNGARQPHNQKYIYGVTQNITVSDYLKADDEFKTNMGLWRAAVDYQARNLPIDPYVLGLWLGDGHSDRAALTTMDSSIADIWQKWVTDVGDGIVVHSPINNKAKTYTASPQLPRTLSNSSRLLKEMELLGNKHIPHEYLTSSREQRLSLLAGIIDTDGHACQPQRCFELSTVSAKLSQDYAYLTRSLGFKTTVRMSHKRSPNGTEGVCYTLIIRGSISEVPVQLARKKVPSSKKNPEISGFRVVDTGIGDYYGFTLEGDGLFLLGDFTVTHNTTALITIARHNIMRKRSVLWFTHEGVDDDLQLKMAQAVMGINTTQLLARYKTPEGMAQIATAMRLVDRYLVYIPWNHPGMTVEELVPVIERRQEERRAQNGGKGFDLLVDDYPGKLSTQMAQGGRMEQRNLDAKVYDYFVQLGLKHRFHVLAAIQTNREGSKVNRDDSRLLTMEDVRESWDTMTMATNVITINRDSKAAARNRVTFYISKSRSSRTGRAVVCHSDYEAGLTHSEQLGATWYYGTQSLSDHIDTYLEQFKGREIPQDSLIAAM
jgi:hypothetical protein